MTGAEPAGPSPDPVSPAPAPGPFARLRDLIGKGWASNLVRQASWMVLLNGSTKLLAMFASGYAARCLGPVNLGMSALVQNAVGQSLLVTNGGFDFAATRVIARHPEQCAPVTETVITTRLVGSLLIALIWCAVVMLVPTGLPRHVALLGVPLLLIGALNLTFAFQALEKLPVQTFLNMAGSLATCVLYVAFFRPGIGPGADLAVQSLTSLSAVVVGVWYYRRYVGSIPIARIDVRRLTTLFQGSWLYWLSNILVFSFTAIQVLMVAWFLGLRDAGVYRSCLMLAAGVDVMYNSINGLMIPRMVVWYKDGWRVLMRRQLQLLPIFIAIALAFSAILFAMTPILYHRLFGAAYEPGIRLFEVLLLSRAIVFVGHIFAYGLIAMHHDRQVVFGVVAASITSLTLSFALIPAMGLSVVPWISVASEVAVMGLCAFFSYRCYRDHPTRTGD